MSIDNIFDDLGEKLPVYEAKIKQLKPLDDAVLTARLHSAWAMLVDISHRDTRMSIVAFAECMAEEPFKNIEAT